MVYKLVNRYGQNFLHKTFKTKKQAEKALSNRKKMLKKEGLGTIHAKIVKVKSKRKSRSSNDYWW